MKLGLGSVHESLNFLAGGLVEGKPVQVHLLSVNLPVCHPYLKLYSTVPTAIEYDTDGRKLCY